MLSIYDIVSCPSLADNLTERQAIDLLQEFDTMARKRAEAESGPEPLYWVNLRTYMHPTETYAMDMVAKSLRRGYSTAGIREELVRLGVPHRHDMTEADLNRLLSMATELEEMRKLLGRDD